MHVWGTRFGYEAAILKAYQENHQADTIIIFLKYSSYRAMITPGNMEKQNWKTGSSLKKIGVSKLKILSFILPAYNSE